MSVANHHIKPRLKAVAPLTVANTKFFIFLNITVFGLILFIFAPRITSFKHIALLPVRFWAALFLLHGLIMAYYLASNNWNRARKSLLAGCFLKSAWVAQFISMAIVKQTTLILLLLGIGVGLLYLQAATYINFTPKYDIHK